MPVGQQRRRFSLDEYSIGWITVLTVEFLASRAMLEEHHERPFAPSDVYSYASGSINGHNIVIACTDEAGPGPAGQCATQMLRSFRNIKFILLVGIGGGVPSQKHDIRLGDVVVSKPGQDHGGVRCYDTGKLTDAGFEPTGSLNRPPTAILNAVNYMRTELTFGDRQFYEYLRDIPVPGYASTDGLRDRLFDAEVPTKEVARAPRSSPEPAIHHGLVASGSWLIKTNGSRRIDLLSRVRGDVLCFEMEAAGLMNAVPTLVVRGISDYCDSSKNDDWHPYASAAAAAYAKWLLRFVRPEEVNPQLRNDSARRSSPIPATTSGLYPDWHNVHEPLRTTHNHHEITKSATLPDYNTMISRRDCLKSLWVDNIDDIQFSDADLSSVRDESYGFILQHNAVQAWVRSPSALLLVSGPTSCGKSTFMKYMLENTASYTTQKKDGEPPVHDIRIPCFVPLGRQMTILECFKALLWNLVLKQSHSMRDFIAAFKQKQKSLERDTVSEFWSPVELQYHFKEAVLRILKTRSIRIFIDGIDRLDENVSPYNEQERIKVDDFLHDLVLRPNQTDNQLSVCVSLSTAPLKARDLGLHLDLSKIPRGLLSRHVSQTLDELHIPHRLIVLAMLEVSASSWVRVSDALSVIREARAEGMSRAQLFTALQHQLENPEYAFKDSLQLQMELSSAKSRSLPTEDDLSRPSALLSQHPHLAPVHQSTTPWNFSVSTEMELFLMRSNTGIYPYMLDWKTADPSAGLRKLRHVISASSEVWLHSQNTADLVHLRMCEAFRKCLEGPRQSRQESSPGMDLGMMQHVLLLPPTPESLQTLLKLSWIAALDGHTGLARRVRERYCNFLSVPNVTRSLLDNFLMISTVLAFLSEPLGFAFAEAYSMPDTFWEDLPENFDRLDPLLPVNAERGQNPFDRLSFARPRAIRFGRPFYRETFYCLYRCKNPLDQSQLHCAMDLAASSGDLATLAMMRGAGIYLGEHPAMPNAHLCPDCLDCKYYYFFDSPLESALQHGHSEIAQFIRATLERG